MSQTSSHAPYRGKRLLDLTLASILLIAFAPLLLGCALAVLLADGRPIIFTQVRIGRGGQPFRILKFRTMRQITGPILTASGDLRITPLGRRLRRAKLDELPQLWNVWRGDMSLVGPRPEVPVYVETAARSFRAIARLRPGITDIASIVFRDEEQVLMAHAAEPAFYERVLLPRKLALARLYNRHASPSLDLKLLVATGCIAAGAEHAAQRIIGEQVYRRARRLLSPARYDR